MIAACDEETQKKWRIVRFIAEKNVIKCVAAL